MAGVCDEATAPGQGVHPMKVRTTLATTLVGLLAVTVVPASPQTGAPGGAKALFHGASGATIRPDAPAPGASPAPSASPTSSLAPQEYMGVRYWVELVEPSGQQRRVTADHVFRAGDRIRLNVQSNRDGALSLVNIGSTGRVTPLFPAARDEAAGAIRANQVYQVPPHGYLRFDHNPGEEILLLVLSPASAGGAAPMGLPGGSLPAAGGLPGGSPPLPGGLPGGSALPPPLPAPGAAPPASPQASAPPLPVPGDRPLPLPQPTASVQPAALPPLPTPAADSPLPFPQPGAAPQPAALPPLPMPASDSPLPFPQPGASPQPAALPPLPMPASDSAPPFPQPGASPQPAVLPPGTVAQPGMAPGAQPSAAQQMMEGAFRLIQQAMQRGAKDLVVETESAGAQPASYAVAPVSSVQGGGMIAVQIKLRHQ